MTEYLIGLASPVKTLPWLSGEGFKASENALTGRNGAADDQDRVIPPYGAEDIGPPLAVESSGNWLCTSRNRAKYQHLAYAVDPEEELRKQCIERGSALLYVPISNRVSGAFRSRDPGQSQLAEVARQRCLGHVPTALEQQLTEIL
ncbi:MAG TPA: hypothetical protein VK565_09435, partial [Gemmatimonadaceae bacterium]|nr:hypothetical protein [Gemmatimonadaceae bacterium]